MTEDNQRRVAVTISAGDYANANKRHSFKYSLNPVPVAFYLVMLGLFLVALSRPYTTTWIGLPNDFFVGVFGGLLVLPFVFYFVLAPMIARRTYAKHKTLQQPFEMSWSNKGFRTSNANGDWTLPWSDFYGWDESDHVFLLYQSPRLFNIVPKRVLTPEQIDDFRQTVIAARGK
jgi:hypothetical protein